MISSKRLASLAVALALSICIWLPSVLHAAPQASMTVAPRHATLRSSYAYHPAGHHGHARRKIHTRPRQSGYYYYPTLGFAAPDVSGYWSGLHAGYQAAGIYAGYFDSGWDYYGVSNYRVRFPDSVSSPNANANWRSVVPYEDLAKLDSSAAIIYTNELASSFQRRAEQAFRTGRYTEAARLANEALLVDHDNGMLLLFSAQANFAAGYFKQAINEIESATNRLNPDQWDDVVANYKEFYWQHDFVSQMDKLVSRIEQNPRDVNALVLRGFEYAGLGYTEAAANDFNQALLIEPDHPLALRLLRGMTGTPAPIQIHSPSDEAGPGQVIPSASQEDAVAPTPVESVLEGPVIDGPLGTSGEDN